MYTLVELESKTLATLKEIGHELNVLPAGDQRRRQSWIDALVKVNPPLLQLLEVAPAASVEQVQPIIGTVEVSPAVEAEPVQEPIESKFGRIVYPRPAQGAIVQVTKNSPGVDPGVDVDRAHEPITQVAKNSPGSIEEAIVQVTKNSPGVDPGVDVDRAQEPIVQAAENSPGVESDLNPILTNADAWNPADFGEVLHAAEPNGQLNLLEWDVSEPPEPDDYEGDIFAFEAAYDRWLLTSQLHEIIHTKNSPGITQAPEPITQNATTGLELPRNESADVRYGRSHPAQPDRNYSSTETAGLGNQEGDRVLEMAGNSQAERGRVIPHQPTQLTQSHDSHIKPQSSHEQRPPDPGDGRVSYLELEIGMLVGHRRDRQHLGKILAIYKSRRGIWRVKIQPLNKSNFVYFDCAALIEQRLLYDYEMKPGGFLPSGSTFDKIRGEKFEVYSRKVRSPKPTNWTAGELSSLSTFKLKQIARDMEIPSIPGTAGKRSLIRAILAEQAISQEKAAAQRERETGRAIVQKQKSGPTTGKKKRASASPLRTQLSLFNVAV